MVKVKYASLANILLSEAVIPEYLFSDFTAENLHQGYSEFISSPEKCAEQREKYDEMRRMMIPDMDAAESVQAFLERV